MSQANNGRPPSAISLQPSAISLVIPSFRTLSYLRRKYETDPSPTFNIIPTIGKGHTEQYRFDKLKVKR